MGDLFEDIFKEVLERRKVKTDRWIELQIVCDVLNGRKAPSYSLLRAWDRYREMLRDHARKESLFLQEAKDGGWGTFKHPALGRVGISRKIGRALAALIEHGDGGHIKTCRCGRAFVAKRSTRKYCSEPCKQLARTTAEYRKEKAEYMRKHRDTLKAMNKIRIRFAKKQSTVGKQNHK